MNVSGVNSGAAAYQSSVRNAFQQDLKDFKALRTALQAGDLGGAQQAFSVLQEDLKDSPQATQASTAQSQQTNPVATDFQTLQSALQAGDLSAAQSAFATLKHDLLQANGLRRHQRHSQTDDTSSSDSSTSETSSSTSSSAPTSSTNSSSVLSTMLDSQA